MVNVHRPSIGSWSFNLEHNQGVPLASESEVSIFMVTALILVYFLEMSYSSVRNNYYLISNWTIPIFRKYDLWLNFWESNCGLLSSFKFKTKTPESNGIFANEAFFNATESKIRFEMYLLAFTTKAYFLAFFFVCFQLSYGEYLQAASPPYRNISKF